MKTSCKRRRCSDPTAVNDYVPCPLVGLKYFVSADTIAATVEVEQEFVNDLKSESIEVKYEHPINPTCIITSCSMIINNREIKCTMKDKDEAQDDYDDAIAQGQSTILTETGETTDVLVFHLGIIPPLGSIKIKLTYVTEVSMEPGSNLTVGLITVPQNIIPVYTSHDVIRPDQSLSKQTTYKSTECIVNTAPPGDVILLCSSVELNCDINVKVTLPEDKPFDVNTISITPTRTGNPTEHYSIAIPVSGSFLGMEGSVPRILFLIDSSDSMKTELATTQLCMKQFIQTIPENSLFNIIRFGDKSESLFTESPTSSAPVFQTVNANSIDQAKVFISAMKANLNEPNLREPLQMIKRTLTEATQIIIITNGAVQDCKNILKEAFSISENSRISAIGMGNSCSRDLIEGLARYSGGSSFYIKNTDGVAYHATSILKQSLQPFINNLSLNVVNEIDGFKPCFPIFRDSHISLVSADNRVMLYGFAPDYFQPENLSGEGLTVEGGFVIKCDRLKGYFVNDEFISEKISKTILNEKYIEPTNRTKSAIVRFSLQRGMSKESLGDLFPSSIIVKNEMSGKDLRLTMTRTGCLAVGDVSRIRYTRSEVSFREIKSTFQLSLRQQDKFVHIPISKSDKELIQNKILVNMPIPKRDLVCVQNEDEILRNYTTKLSTNFRINQLTAAKRIREIEDMQRIGEFNDEVTPEAIRLSKSFNVLSKYTALVAVDEEGILLPVNRLTKIDINIVKRKKKVGSPKITSKSTQRKRKSSSPMWKSERKETLASEATEICPPISAQIISPPGLSLMASMPAEAMEGEAMEEEAMEKEEDEGFAFSVDQSPVLSLAASVPISTTSTLCDQLISMQLGDGSWIASHELFALLSVSPGYLTGVYEVTAFVLNYLESNFGYLKSQWEFTAFNAMNFLKNNNCEHLITHKQSIPPHQMGASAMSPYGAPPVDEQVEDESL